MNTTSTATSRLDDVMAEAARILHEMQAPVPPAFWQGDLYLGGLDSLTLVMLLSELEQRCGVRALSPDDLEPGTRTLPRMLGLA